MMRNHKRLRLSIPLRRDIIFDILSELPIKSLCRFRCVSKSFSDLITDSEFVKTHLTRTQAQRRERVVLSCVRVESLHSIDLETAYACNKVSDVCDFPLNQSISKLVTSWIQFCGSCNGLLCIAQNGHFFFVYNPSTRESKQIPWIVYKDNDMSGYSDNYKLNGFGYAESIDDYKFVMISQKPLDTTITTPLLVYIFSLRNNSWKIMEDYFGYNFNPCGSARYDKGTQINGAIHWVFNLHHNGHGIGDHARILAAFDLVEEKFKSLPFPDAITNINFMSTHLVAVDGCLCLQVGGHIQGNEFWVMKEYGVKESWTRIWIDKPQSCRYIPLRFCKNYQTVLIALFKTHESVDLVIRKGRNNGNYKDRVLDGLNEFLEDVYRSALGGGDASLYVESLVSPNYNYSDLDLTSSSRYGATSPPPNHFICPITMKVMEDPCVAADGFTYEREAIEKWLGESNMSPHTNSPLPSMGLIPNRSLLSAIKEWKSKEK